MIISFLLMTAMLTMTPHESTANLDGGCVLSADNGEVWLNVYQEVGNGQKGNAIGQYHLQKGDTQIIGPQPNDRIRYDYKVDPNDPYHGNVGATCAGGETVKVP
jgi:hypothetical protein